MEEAGLILDNYQQILDANRDGLWKKHPMRVQKEDGKIVSTPLRFNLDKNQWKKVIETKSFKDVTITRRLSKILKNSELSKEIIAYANNEGFYIMNETEIDNWRMANKEIKEDIKIDQARQASNN